MAQQPADRRGDRADAVLVAAGYTLNLRLRRFEVLSCTP